MKQKLIIAVAACVILAGTFGGYLLLRNRKPPTITVKRNDLTVSVKAKANVEASKSAAMAFKVAGKVNYVGVEKGDTVKKGKLLASIDATNYKNAYANSLQDYMTTRWQFDQTQDDYKDYIQTDTIKRTKDESQFSLNKSVTDVETALWTYGSTSLYAPFDGTVTQVNTEVGDLASQTTPALVVQTLNELKLTAQVSETGIAGVRVGDQVTWTMDAYPGKTFHGIVTRIDPAATVIAGNNLFLTDIHPSDLPVTAKPGMKADISIVTRKKTGVLTVPLYTVTGVKDNRGSVRIWTDGHESDVTVGLGIRGDGGMVEITGGLTSGSELITDLSQ